MKLPAGTIAEELSEGMCFVSKKPKLRVVDASVLRC